MAKAPMQTPGAPGATKARRPNRTRGQVDPTSTSRTRQTMGTEAYRLTDDASASDVRQGFLESRPMREDIESVMGVAARRPQVSAQERLGAGYRVQARRSAASETYSSTLANGRIVSAVSGVTDNFRGDSAVFGPLGPR